MLIDQTYLNLILQAQRNRELLANELMIKRAAAGNDGALSVLDSTCRRVIGVPLDVVRCTSPERLEELVQANGRTKFDSLFLGELLLEDAKVCEQMREAGQAIVSRLQAFRLFVDALPLLESKEQAEYRKKIDVLAAELEPVGNDPYIRSQLESYRLKNKQTPLPSA